MARGIPNATASMSAREKLRTDITEMMVDAKHRFNAFRTTETGATSERRWSRRNAAASGAIATIAKRVYDTV